MKWVLDASAAYLLYRSEDQEAGADRARDIVRSGLGDLIAPHIFPYELAQVMFAKHPQRIPDEQERIRSHAALVSLPDLHSSDWQRIGELCSQHQISAYDAAYLDLALRASGTLVTNDRVLHGIAEKMLGEGRSLLCRGTG